VKNVTLLVKTLSLLILSLLMTGCLGMPDKVSPVQNFEAERYLGTWYEIARLDHSFERGLERITATYTERDDGGISVLNRGYSIEDQSWSEAEGKAYFVNSDQEGYLKVSFFGPFYGSYVIFELDEAYQHAFISGPDTSYLWLLARTPTVDPSVIDLFKRKAKASGFDTSELIFVSHGNQLDEQ